MENTIDPALHGFTPGELVRFVGDTSAWPKGSESFPRVGTIGCIDGEPDRQHCQRINSVPVQTRRGRCYWRPIDLERIAEDSLTEDDRRAYADHKSRTLREWYVD